MGKLNFFRQLRRNKGDRMGFSKETMESLVNSIMNEVNERIDDEKDASAQPTTGLGFPSHMKRGKRYFIRTVTFHIIGTVKRKEGDWVELRDAKHVRSSGEDFGKFLASGEMSDSRTYEFPGSVTIKASSVTDFCPWTAD